MESFGCPWNKNLTFAAKDRITWLGRHMAQLLSYKSRRTPQQNAILSFIVMMVSFVAFGAIPTQWFAAHYQYDANLGPGLLRMGGVVLYTPTDWVFWGWRLADIELLKRDVHTMLLLGASGSFLAIIFGVIVGLRLAKYNDGMDGLHGTAHFAEREDVDKTGFINARGHKATGVVVGSVMLDGRGRVIHPHHKRFDRRNEPIMVRGKGWRYFQKYPKRDSNHRPMYRPRKSTIRKIELLRDGGNTHIFAFCPTRSGKGVGMVIPTLLTWPDSVMVNDPKGEAYALSGGFRRAAGQNVIKFEPACLDGTGARWNPLDEIRIFTPHDVSDAQMIMAMACDPEGEGLKDYFDKAGYEFLTALGLHMRYAERDGSLSGVANFLGDPNWDNDKQMYTHMMQAEHDPEGRMGWLDPAGKPTKTHPMIANAAKTMLNKEDKDRSGVLSTAKSLLSLYLDPIIARNTSCSDFLVRDLMTGEKPVSLYYVVGPSDMERMVPLTRLFYSLFIRRNAVDMKFEGGKSVANYSHSLLMIIDEAISLRKLPILQEALSYVAGYGIRMFLLVQDITQVEDLYGDKQTFDSGAETRVVYAPNKIETAEKLARMSGKTTITEENVSSSREVLGIKAGSVSVSTTKTARDLITADEFMSMHDQDMVIFIKGQPPVYGRKAFYYENPTLLARAAMPPPEKSAVLRIPEQKGVNTPQVVEEVPAEPTPSDQWAASRATLQDRVVTAVAVPVAMAAPVETSNLDDGFKQGVVRRRNRYAEKVKVVTETEMEQVKELVADVALVNKVASIDAF